MCRWWVSRNRSLLALPSRGHALALRGRKFDLSQAKDVRGDFDGLVVADELERLLERQSTRRDQAHEDVSGSGAHVREFLRFGGIDVEVVVASVLPDDHPLVQLVPGFDEERSALLQSGDREAGRAPLPVGDKTAGRPGPKLAVPGFPGLEDMMEDAGAAGLGQALGAEPDQSPCRDEILQA